MKEQGAGETCNRLEACRWHGGNQYGWCATRGPRRARLSFIRKAPEEIAETRKACVAEKENIFKNARTDKIEQVDDPPCETARPAPLAPLARAKAPATTMPSPSAREAGPPGLATPPKKTATVQADFEKMQ